MVGASPYVFTSSCYLAKNLFIILVGNSWKPSENSILHNIMDISCHFKTITLALSCLIQGFTLIFSRMLENLITGSLYRNEF